MLLANPVNPLAAQKGKKFTCELCKKPAHLQCSQCRVICYCTELHQREDWIAIHEKVCQLVNVLHTAKPHVSTRYERGHHQKQQELRRRHVIDIALQEGRRWLSSGKPALAIPAALQGVKYLTQLADEGFTESLTDTAPAYLILSEAAIQLGRVKEAENYLAQVQWSVLQCQDNPPDLLSSLYRNLGQLCMTQGKTEEARRHFAEDIYQCSVGHGTESIHTAGGYFYLGAAFIREGRFDLAISLHNQVIKSWNGYLSHILSSDKPYPDHSTRTEAMFELHSIRELRERSSSESVDLVSLYHTLSLLYLTSRDKERATWYVQRALEHCSRDNDLYPALQSLLERITSDNCSSQSHHSSATSSRQ